MLIDYLQNLNKNDRILFFNELIQIITIHSINNNNNNNTNNNMNNMNNNKNININNKSNELKNDNNDLNNLKDLKIIKKLLNLIDLFPELINNVNKILILLISNNLKITGLFIYQNNIIIKNLIKKILNPIKLIKNKKNLNDDNDHKLIKEIINIKKNIRIVLLSSKDPDFIKLIYSDLKFPFNYKLSKWFLNLIVNYKYKSYNILKRINIEFFIKIILLENDQLKKIYNDLLNEFIERINVQSDEIIIELKKYFFSQKKYIRNSGYKFINLLTNFHNNNDNINNKRHSKDNNRYLTMGTLEKFFKLKYFENYKEFYLIMQELLLKETDVKIILPIFNYLINIEKEIKILKLSNILERLILNRKVIMINLLKLKNQQFNYWCINQISNNTLLHNKNIFKNFLIQYLISDGQNEILLNMLMEKLFSELNNQNNHYNLTENEITEIIITEHPWIIENILPKISIKIIYKLIFIIGLSRETTKRLLKLVDTNLNLIIKLDHNLMDPKNKNVLLYNRINFICNYFKFKKTKINCLNYLNQLLFQFPQTKRRHSNKYININNRILKNHDRDNKSDHVNGCDNGNNIEDINKTIRYYQLINYNISRKDLPKIFSIYRYIIKNNPSSNIVLQCISLFENFLKKEISSTLKKILKSYIRIISKKYFITKKKNSQNKQDQLLNPQELFLKYNNKKIFKNYNNIFNNKYINDKQLQKQFILNFIEFFKNNNLFKYQNYYLLDLFNFLLNNYFFNKKTIFKKLFFNEKNLQ
ncbi:hypothetical protein M0813_11369 [Anaeramoeba flamelloides]|uniref:Symplekin C-terminal domain-containing protein n=1 Tax=Anaeramoeba flamelloides TaxID=1746091 RepID=A0ABQ8ZFJ2_9EUKA|nr:hypothetical protein M0813_11369 [Anaeramoeba flamelloides]